MIETVNPVIRRRVRIHGTELEPSHKTRDERVWGTQRARKMSMPQDGPVADITSEKLGILGPDRAGESRGVCENRPPPSVASGELE
jgi:hypothetical protein